MQEDIGINNQFDSKIDDFGPAPFRGFTRSRAIALVLVLLVVVLLTLLPPFLNVNRYKRQIVTSISTSLGRPVHIDSVSLNLLPLPSFTLTNFVISEDPAFGAEPVLQANEVRATLRASSLWRMRVEFSRISLDAPSVNLVHLPDGRWNLESILLQASRMPAAPTSQKSAGPAQRFPYIEATGGRLNLKMGLEKMPISLTEADFALWLPEPNEWNLRLKAHPARTDAPPTDTGVLRLEGTLGHAATLSAVPIDLRAEWSTVPLGALSWVVMGHDAGIRGEMTLNASLKGTVGQNALDTRLTLKRVRKSDFVPEQTLDAEIGCTAQFGDVFRSLHQIHCGWPAGSTGYGMTLTGELSDLRHPGAMQGSAVFVGVPASALLQALRVVSNRASSDLKASGTIAGNLTFGAQPYRTEPLAATADKLTLTQAKLVLGEDKPFIDQDITASLLDKQLIVAPIAISLTANTRETAALEAKISSTGYTLRLSGAVLPSRLRQLAQVLPEFGDGLESILTKPSPDSVQNPIRVDLISVRAWPSPPTWSTAPLSHPSGSHKRSH